MRCACVCVVLSSGRGLVNTGNACFRNVVLQALLSCEAFYRCVRLHTHPQTPPPPSFHSWARTRPGRLLVGLRPAVKAGARGVGQMEGRLPTWTALTRLSAAFEDPSLAALVAYKKGEDEAPAALNGRRRKGRGGGQLQQQQGGAKNGRKEQWLHSVRPDDFLGLPFSEFRSSEQGQQEDAQVRGK